MNTCCKCGFIGGEELFHTRNVCKKCRREYTKEYQRKSRDTLSDSYIKQLLRDSFFADGDIPQDFIIAKRAQIMLLREIRTREH